MKREQKELRGRMSSKDYYTLEAILKDLVHEQELIEDKALECERLMYEDYENGVPSCDEDGAVKNHDYYWYFLHDRSVRLNFLCNELDGLLHND